MRSAFPTSRKGPFDPAVAVVAAVGEKVTPVEILAAAAIAAAAEALQRTATVVAVAGIVGEVLTAAAVAAAVVGAAEFVGVGISFRV